MLSVAQINMKSALLGVGLEVSRSPRDTRGSVCLPDQVPLLCSPTDRNPLIYISINLSINLSISGKGDSDCSI